MKPAAHDGFPYALNVNRFIGAAPLPGQAFAVVGVPWDGAVTHRPGARFGPQAIRRASLMLCDAAHPLFNVSAQALLGGAGDMHLSNAAGLAVARDQIRAQAGALIARHHTVFLGGDHFITLAVLQAMHAQHGPVAMVHFDAHCDTWQDHFGEPLGHGIWTYEAIKQGLVLPQKTVHIGLRSGGRREARGYVQSQGGLIIGMDCVEVVPAYDHAELTANAAATLVWTYLFAQVAKRFG